MIPLRTNHVYWARVNIKSMPDVVAIPLINSDELTFHTFSETDSQWTVKCGNKPTQQLYAFKYGNHIEDLEK